MSQTMREGLKCFLILLPCLFIGIACNRTLRPVDVTGTYEARVGYGTGTLTLNSNNTFIQTFTYRSGRRVQHSGTWIFTQPNKILLHNALVIGQNLGAPGFGLIQSDWFLEIDTLGGKKWMEFNPDMGWFFHKVK